MEKFFTFDIFTLWKKLYDHYTVLKMLKIYNVCIYMYILDHVYSRFLSLYIDL